MLLAVWSLTSASNASPLSVLRHTPATCCGQHWHWGVLWLTCLSFKQSNPCMLWQCARFLWWQTCARHEYVSPRYVWCAKTDRIRQKDCRLCVAFYHQGDPECQGPLLGMINIVHFSVFLFLFVCSSSLFDFLLNWLAWIRNPLWSTEQSRWHVRA